jgi:hypothetical protein
MQLDTREIKDRIPGAGEVVTRVRREWICRECDYFEEAEADEMDR